MSKLLPFAIRAVMKPAAAIAFALAAASCASVLPAKEAVTAPSGPATPAYQLSDILGATPQALDQLLGAPALSRREGAGEYRRYSLSQCALIVILYPDDKGEARAAHVDTAALGSDETKPVMEDCLAVG